MQNKPTRTQTKFSFVQFVKSLFQGTPEQPIVYHHYYASDNRLVINGVQHKVSTSSFDALFNQAFGSNVQSSKL